MPCGLTDVESDIDLTLDAAGRRANARGAKARPRAALKVRRIGLVELTQATTARYQRQMRACDLALRTVNVYGFGLWHISDLWGVLAWLVTAGCEGASGSQARYQFS